MLTHEEVSVGNSVVASFRADKALRANCRAPELWSFVMSAIACSISGGRTRPVDADILDRCDMCYSVRYSLFSSTYVARNCLVKYRRIIT